MNVKKTMMMTVVVAGALTMGAKGCGDDCEKLRVAQELACSADPRSVECAEAGALIEQYCRVPGPTPTPVPTPTPTPTPTPVPTPVPTPPPVASACPKPLAEGARVYLNNKVHGQGFDSTVRIAGDPETCMIVSGVPDRDCHLEGWRGPAGDDPTARVRCEMELLGKPLGLPAACPVWEGRCYSTTPGEQECPVTFDHFGSVEFRDDPMTPEFEGQPAECSAQRDEGGQPEAGFFTVAHGRGQVRACRPDGLECGPWVSVNH